MIVGVPQAITQSIVFTPRHGCNLVGDVSVINRIYPAREANIKGPLHPPSRARCFFAVRKRDVIEIVHVRELPGGGAGSNLPCRNCKRFERSIASPVVSHWLSFRFQLARKSYSHFLQLLDDVRVARFQILAFSRAANVLPAIVSAKAGTAHPGDCPDFVGKMQFPLSVAKALQLAQKIVVQGSRLSPCRLFAAQQPDERLPVELFTAELRADDLRNCRQDVDRHGGTGDGHTFFDPSRPMHCRKHADTAFKSGHFETAHTTRRARMIAPYRPGTIIGSENHQGVLIDTLVAQGLHDARHLQIDFVDHVLIQTATRSTHDFIPHEYRDMRGAVG